MTDQPASDLTGLAAYHAPDPANAPARLTLRFARVLLTAALGETTDLALILAGMRKFGPVTVSGDQHGWRVTWPVAGADMTGAAAELRPAVWAILAGVVEEMRQAEGRGGIAAEEGE